VSPRHSPARSARRLQVHNVVEQKLSFSWSLNALQEAQDEATVNLDPTNSGHWLSFSFKSRIISMFEIASSQHLRRPSPSCTARIQSQEAECGTQYEG